MAAPYKGRHHFGEPGAVTVRLEAIAENRKKLQELREALGDKVGIRGPFGTHFPVDGAMQGKDLLFICGGIGLVPVRSAIQYVLDNRKQFGRVTILYGTRSPAERLFHDETGAWSKAEGVTYMETVDRGDPEWKGSVGVITTPRSVTSQPAPSSPAAAALANIAPLGRVSRPNATRPPFRNIP